jgi:hypothetical protein
MIEVHKINAQWGGHACEFALAFRKLQIYLYQKFAFFPPPNVLLMFAIH